MTISGELQDDAYASVKVNDNSVDLTVYGGVITVTEDDEVTFTTLQSQVEMNEKLTDTFLIRSYTYAYTLEAYGTISLTASDFGVEAISGYTPIALQSARTGSLSITISNLSASVSDNILSIRSNTNQAAGGTASIVIVFVKTNLIGE